MEEKYTLIMTQAVDGYVEVRRASDNRVARVKLSWLQPAPGTPAGAGIMIARSRTKAIRMDGLSWEVET